MLLIITLGNTEVYATTSVYNINLYEIEMMLEEDINALNIDGYMYHYGVNVDEQGDGRYDIFGIALTEDEINLLNNNWWAAIHWFYSANKAINKAKELFENSNDSTIANAFQHAYWNLMMSKHISLHMAEAFANAHENYDDNSYYPKMMDLYNNEKGRTYASTFNSLANYTDDELADMLI